MDPRGRVRAEPPKAQVQQAGAAHTYHQGGLLTLTIREGCSHLPSGSLCSPEVDYGSGSRSAELTRDAEKDRKEKQITGLHTGTPVSQLALLPKLILVLSHSSALTNELSKAVSAL
jgi:hypothetical protein